MSDRRNRAEADKIAKEIEKQRAKLGADEVTNGLIEDSIGLLEQEEIRYRMRIGQPVTMRMRFDLGMTVTNAVAIGLAVEGARLPPGRIGSPAGVEIYTPLNKGPLLTDLAVTFRSATYRRVQLTEEITLYRAISEGVSPTGRFWTRMKPSGPLQSVVDSALDQNWGNKAVKIVEIRVPSGTVVYEGVAPPQRGLVGGGNQVFIPHVDPSWVN